MPKEFAYASRLLRLRISAGEEANMFVTHGREEAKFLFGSRHWLWAWPGTQTGSTCVDCPVLSLSPTIFVYGRLRGPDVGRTYRLESLTGPTRRQRKLVKFGHGKFLCAPRFESPRQGLRCAITFTQPQISYRSCKRT